MSKILVIEDHFDIQELITEFMNAQNYKIDVANDGVEGVRLFQNNEYDLVLLEAALRRGNATAAGILRCNEVTLNKVGFTVR